MRNLDKRFADRRIAMDFDSFVAKIWALFIFAIFIVSMSSATAFGANAGEAKVESFSNLFNDIFEQTSLATTHLRDAIESPDSSPTGSGVFGNNTCEGLSLKFGILDLERTAGFGKFRYRTEGRLSKCDIYRGYFRYIDQVADASRIAEDQRSISINDYRVFDYNNLNGIIQRFGLPDEDFEHVFYDLVIMESGIDQIVEFKSFFEYMVTVERVYNDSLLVPDSYMRFAFDEDSKLKRALVKWPDIRMTGGDVAKADFEIAQEIYTAIVAFLPDPEFSDVRVEPIIAESICKGTSTFYHALRVSVLLKGNAGVEFDVSYFVQDEEIPCGGIS